MFKSGRHYTDDLHGLTVELNLLSDDVWVASETTCPETIGEDDDVISAGLELFGFEYTTVRRGHTQHREEVGGGCETEQTFRRLALNGEVTAGVVVGRHLFEDGVLVVLVEEVCG